MSIINPYFVVPQKTKIQNGISTIIGIVIGWTFLSYLGVFGYEFPSPLKMIDALSYLSYYNGESRLFDATLWSVSRIFLATILVLVIGIPLGIILGSSPYINSFCSPIVDPARSAPIVALIHVLTVWFGIGEGMKVLFLFLGAFVYLVPMVRDAIQTVPPTYWIQAMDIGATRFEAITKVVVPLAMPKIAEAVITSVSIMWTYITVAEYVNAEHGLGQLIQIAKGLSATDQVIAVIFVIILLALVTYQLMKYIKNKLYFWEIYI